MSLQRRSLLTIERDIARLVEAKRRQKVSRMHNDEIIIISWNLEPQQEKGLIYYARMDFGNFTLSRIDAGRQQRTRWC